MNHDSVFVQLADAIGVDPDYLSQIAAACGLPKSGVWLTDDAADLFVAHLASEHPAVARERLDTYRRMPARGVFRLSPTGCAANLIADEPIKPGDGRRAAQRNKSICHAIAQVIDDLGGDPKARRPYAIQIQRRSAYPAAFMNEYEIDGTERILQYLEPDADAGYLTVSLRVSIRAEAHGAILSAMADVLRAQWHAALAATQKLGAATSDAPCAPHAQDTRPAEGHG